MMRRALLLVAVAAALGGCDGVQSMMGGDGEHGRTFVGLFEIFLAVTGFFYLVVIAALLAALLRRRRDRSDPRPEKSTRHDPLLRTGLVVWIGVVTLGLAGLTVASYFADRENGQARPQKALKITIIANQWWWDVRYQDFTPYENVRTANELHLPVGVPVHIELKSNDVIHSFWVPNLAGKQDLIPGRISDLLLIARKTGSYRGQCAEFCGMQHAHMALDVTVHTPEEFARWRQRMLTPPPVPTAPLVRAGYEYFMTRECSMCHRIAGTPASAQVAPDLSHVASRKSIGAGTFPMTRGHLQAWVADPQSAKPGNRMPYIGLNADELNAVVAYLETLK